MIIKYEEFEPFQRHLNPELGGGSLLDVGVYVISFALMIFEKNPESVFGFGHIGEFGSDEQGAALLKYDKGEIADLSFALHTNAVNEAISLLGQMSFLSCVKVRSLQCFCK